MTHIEELREVIRRLHGADAAHVQSVPVKETFKGETVWDGIVEVFDLHGHPTASRVYAWAHDTDAPDARRHVTVLHSHPIESARQAVRAAIVQEFKNLEPAKTKKPGRPKLAKGHAKARIVPVRFNAELLRRVESAAKASGQNVSEWIRSTLDAATN